MLILPNSSSQQTVLPSNFLIYLKPLSTISPSLPLQGSATTFELNAVAYYLSTFDYVVMYPSILESDILDNLQIMEMAYSYNPNINFYAYVDGMSITDGITSGTPSSQLDNLINTIIFNYNTNTGYPSIRGIYYDNFEFLNVGIGINNSQTFRDTQIYAMLIASQNNLYTAASCPGRYGDTQLGNGGYQFITNLPYILNYTFSNLHPNQLIHFNSTFTIVDYNLYGYEFWYAGAWNGFTSKNQFLNSLMLLNSILLDPFNISCNFSMAITTRDMQGYASPLFFNQDAQTGGTGIANMFYNLATLLNSNNVATSAYADFYADTNDLTNNIVFPFNSVTYYPRSKMFVKDQNTIAFTSNPDINIVIAGSDTSSMIINGYTQSGGLVRWA